MRAQLQRPNKRTAATIGTVVVFWMVALSGLTAQSLAQTPPGTTIVNVASAEHGAPPVIAQSNPVLTSVAAPVALSVTKTVDPSGTAAPGATLNFHLLVENPAATDITGAVITDPLDMLLMAPGALTTGAVPDTGVGGGTIAVSGSYDSLPHRLVWQVPLIPAGARFTLEFTAAIDAAAPEDSMVRNTSFQTSDQDPAGTASNEVVLGILSPSLSISKEASRGRVEVGEVVGYTVLVENSSASLDLSAIQIRDRLPKGFRYMEGSASIDGNKPDGLVVEGRDLTVTVGTIAQGGRARLSYAAVPTAESEGLDGINVAWVSGLSPSSTPVAAGPAKATVRVAGSLLSGEAVIVGRVFVDDDRDGVFDEGEVGVPRARVFLEDGTYAMTDVVGKYHLEGVRPGLHVMKTDVTTLPEGLGSFASWSRSAGTGATQFVDAGPDQMFKTNVATGGWGLSIARLRAEVTYLDAKKGERLDIFPPLLASAVFEEGSADVGRHARPVVESYAALIRESGGKILSLDVTPSHYPLADEQLMLARAERLRSEMRRLVLAAAPHEPVPIASTPRPPTYVTDASEEGAPAVIDFSGEMTADMEALEERVKLMDAEPAVLSPIEGASITAERIDVDVKLPSHLTAKLAVNGVEIGEDRIAVRMETSMTKLVFIRYLGVPVGEGRNSLVLRGLDQWGNERVWVERIVNGIGAPHHVSIQVDDATGTADGLTPARIVVDVRDKQGLPVRDGTLVTLDVDEGEFMGVDAAADREGFQAGTTDGRAEAHLAPIDSTEGFKVSARAGEAEGEGEFSLAPELRDWIVAGVGEASIGNRGYSDGSDLSDLLEDDEDADGRLALFARGRLFGSSLMTLSYDSERERDRDRVFRQIAPDRFFPIYGDSSLQGYSIQGQSRFSMRLDQPRSSMIVGDFTTGLSGGDLLRYDRALTGGAGRIALGGFSMQSFGATTPQTQIRDELAGAGTSGPYRLSVGFVVVNSEKVIIETRDRFHPERTIDRKEMTRFADYDIDYEGGSLFFKRPVPFQDESFNPVLVVVTYESLEGDGEDTVAGGRIGYGFRGLGEFGATYVTESRAGGDYVLRGTDFAVDRAFGGASLRISGEAAQTESGSSPLSGAVGFRVGTTWRKANVAGYYRKVSSGFENPSRSGLSDVGTIRWGVEGGAALDDGSRVKGELYSQEDSINDRERRVGALDWEKVVRRFTTRSGFKDVRGLDPGTNEDEASRLVSAGASMRLSERLDGSLERQQVVWGSALTDYPTRTSLGLGWKVIDGFRSFLKQEFDQADLGDTSRTVIGLESNLSRRTVMESRYSLEDALNGSRGMAHLGLRTRLPLNEDWLGDASLERVVTTSGISTGDFTALGMGAEYLPARVKFSTRYELRLGENEDIHAITGAGATRITRAVSLFTRQRLFLIDPDEERSRFDGDGLIGLAFRPVEDDSLNFLLKLQAFKGDALRSAGSPRARSYLGLFETNYEPLSRVHLLGRVAMKESLDTFDGRTFSSRTWLGETRALVDIGTRFNAGLSARLLNQLATGTTVSGFGLEGGVRLAPDTWLVGGYNITGFEESGFGDNDRRSEGPFFSVRFKFDESTIVGLTRRGGP